MDDGSKQHADDTLNGLPPWAQCEVFCIEDYAAAEGSRCGWRGRVQDAQRDEARRFICPRCGRATLLRIPSGNDDQ